MKTNNKNLRKSLNGYYSEIKTLLPLDGKQKRDFMANLKNSISSFLDENPTASFDDVRERFGVPSDIIEADIDADTYASIAVKSRKRLKLGIVLAICLIFLSFLYGFLAILFQEQIEGNSGYTEVSEVVELWVTETDL